MTETVAQTPETRRASVSPTSTDLFLLTPSAPSAIGCQVISNKASPSSSQVVFIMPMAPAFLASMIHEVSPSDPSGPGSNT